MSDQTAQEPTMEEILASIRRIISEDEAPAEPQAAPAAAPVAHAVSPAMMDETPSHIADVAYEADDEVLELTQRYEEPAPAPMPEPSPIRPFETVGDIEAAPREMPAPAPVVSFSQTETERLVSDRAAESAAAAFGALASTLLMPREGRSLEDVVKELMRPLLKDWLDANLPAIVEAQVQSEVERIARRGAR
jgi:cell pole-organizing protein PopZ